MSTKFSSPSWPPPPLPPPKANEYKNTACKNLNYSHAKFCLGDVTFDDTTISVYFNYGTNDVGTNRKIWVAFSGKTGNGGSCTGTELGWVPLGDNGNSDEGCVNINNVFSVRIKCVRERRG
ncbi:hypothetical protein B0H65DRAFT_592402 [Neurospora tetraspora]|uniref:Uncharacterized protein n=1 Tax=Neurospora tetraspora TaxID=94610 RepID=A0AAE0J7Q0_9PEZI|nr:hypothetical protein B0H65DRAFT_592402 [Neurospora tetraspora]